MFVRGVLFGGGVRVMGVRRVCKFDSQHGIAIMGMFIARPQ